MGFIRKTPAGTFRAFFRDPSGKQRSKNFDLKKDAKMFLAEIESTVVKGSYIDPSAGRVLFSTVAESWFSGYSAEPTTITRVRMALDNQVLPQWGDVPIGKIDHLGVAEWVKDLGQRRAPATVTKALQVMSAVMKSAVRSRMIAVNPCDDVKVSGGQRAVRPGVAISRDDFFRLLAAVPSEKRLLPALSGYCGLRWGEAAGLDWRHVDLDTGELTVAQVAIEIGGTVAIRKHPKTAAGHRVIPIPDALHKMLMAVRPSDLSDLVCPTATGSPHRRANFRKQVWRPSLVRAGLLGEVGQVHTGQWEAVWQATNGVVRSEAFDTETEAVAAVAARDAGGIRFHDLRHSYTTWLVSAGVPVNIAQRLLGHAQASTTLNRYTHHLSGGHDEVGRVFSD